MVATFPGLSPYPIENHLKWRRSAPSLSSQGGPVILGSLPIPDANNHRTGDGEQAATRVLDPAHPNPVVES